MIVERLREEADYMSIKDYNMIAFDLRVDASLVKSVVEDFGLFVFTDNGKYFYSESLRRRMLIKDEKRKARSEAGKKGMEKRWGNNKKITDLSETDNNVITDLSETDNKKNKEKENKEIYATHIQRSEQISENYRAMIDELKRSQIWKEALMKKLRLSCEQIDNMLEKMYLDMICRNIKPKTQNFQSFAFGWIATELKSKNGIQQQEDRFSRRRGVDAPSWKPEDFTETF